MGGPFIAFIPILYCVLSDNFYEIIQDTVLISKLSRGKIEHFNTKLSKSPLYGGCEPPNPSVFSGIRFYLPAQWVQ